LSHGRWSGGVFSMKSHYCGLQWYRRSGNLNGERHS